MTAAKNGDVRTVGVIAKRSSREAVRTARELAEWLVRRGLEVHLEETVARAAPSGAGADGPFYQPGERYDLVVVLGGDGTLLGAARAAPAGVPILGVNLGTLGFLTEVGRAELYPSLVDVFSGRYRLEERALLDVEIQRAEGKGERFRVLNDAVIAKSALSRIIQLTLRVDERLVTTYRSDGLILSTPTGSTAYNLSAGGPIVHPELPVALLTPICPHTFSLRPIVVPADSAIEVTLETQSAEVYLTLDGQEGLTLGYLDKVRITRSGQGIHLVRTSGRTFYDSLRGKLRWGG